MYLLYQSSIIKGAGNCTCLKQLDEILFGCDISPAVTFLSWPTHISFSIERRSTLLALSSSAEAWPDLPYGAWRDTCATLQLYTQIIGKVRVAQTLWLNHSWHVVLYLTARGLTTSPIPYGQRAFQIDFDFIDHVLAIEVSDGRQVRLALRPQPVADFYADVLHALTELGMPVQIHGKPNEIADAIPFSEDRIHQSYDPEFVQRFLRVLLQVDRIFKYFRTGFLGKASPVHFFWGSFDLAVTRFSGRVARHIPVVYLTCLVPLFVTLTRMR
jgi:Family of unknown function (DUF5996)